MQDKIIIAFGVLITVFFSAFGWWMENGPDRNKENKENEEKQDRTDENYEVN